MTLPRFSRRPLRALGAGVSLAFVTLLSVLVWSGIAGATSSRSVTSRSYTDVDYEWLEQGTPDIKRVTVSRRAGGRVTFRIAFAKPIPMRRDFGSEVFINADRSLATGDREDGWDYILDYSRPAANEPPYLSMWVDASGKEYEVTPAKANSLSFHSTARSVTFRIAAHDLGPPLAYRLLKANTIPYLPKLGTSFDFDTVTSADWLDDAAGADWLDVRTFPGRDTGTSIHTESMVLLWLLIGLVLLVVGQVMIGMLGSLPSNAAGGNGQRWDFVVFGAAVAFPLGIFAGLFSLLPLAALNKYVFHVFSESPPDAFLTAWLATGALAPCVVLGYLSGRWWSFLGAAPLLVLFPVGIVLSSGPADWFLTLPVTAAVAVALSFGSAVRTVRTRGRSAWHHHPLPA